jgi:hypothetical protein
MTKSIISALFGALMATSCAGSGITTLSANPDESARVRLASGYQATGGGLFKTIPSIEVKTYDDDTCSEEKTIAKLRAGPFLGAKIQTLGIPLGEFHKNAATELYLPAQQEMTILFDSGAMTDTTMYRCGVMMTVNFEVGKDYELVADEYLLNLQRCSVKLYEIIPGGEGERKLIQSFDRYQPVASEKCVSEFQKIGWGTRKISYQPSRL